MFAELFRMLDCFSLFSFSYFMSLLEFGMSVGESGSMFSYSGKL